jgi:hypothetical protein
MSQGVFSVGGQQACALPYGGGRSPSAQNCSFWEARHEKQRAALAPDCAQALQPPRAPGPRRETQSRQAGMSAEPVPYKEAPWTQ